MAYGVMISARQARAEEKQMHKTKQGALKAARAALGEDAIEGVDFALKQTGAGWAHVETPPATDAAAHPERPAPKPKAAKKARFKAAPKKTARPATGKRKSDVLLEMLQSAGGATSAEMEEAVGWKPHSVRGFLGTQRKKGVRIDSKKLQGEPTIYRIPPAASEPVGDVV